MDLYAGLACITTIYMTTQNIKVVMDTQITFIFIDAPNVKRDLGYNMKPVQLQNMDFTALIEQCQEEIDDVNDGNYSEDSDNIHYMYEAAMMAVFGKDVFKWMNENT